MKGPLLRSLFVRYRKILLSMTLIASLCTGISVGMVNVYRSLTRTFDRYVNDYGVADAVISIETTNESAVRTLEAVPGIESVETRLTTAARFYTSDGRLLSAFVATLNREEVQKLYHWTQAEEVPGDAVFIDLNCALANEISAGDVIRVKVEDGYRPFTIAGMVSTPETLSGAKMKGMGSFYNNVGYIYVPISLLAAETEKEFSRMMAEWEEKQQEYLEAEAQAREELEKGEKALAEGRDELQSREKEFRESKAELDEHLKELTDARVQLMLGRRDLEDAETTAEEKKAQLEEGLERAEEQLLQLEDRQAELEEIRNDLNSLQVRLEDAKGRLTAAREQIDRNSGTLLWTLSAMRGARQAWQEARESGSEIELPDVIKDRVDMTAAEIEEKLKEQGITPEALDDTIHRAEAGAAQLAGGKTRIQNGIREISQDYLPQISDYIEQTEQGLEVVSQAKESLRGGIAQMREGLQAISEFEENVPENRDSLEEMLGEVEEGIRSIYEGIEEGETALAEGKTELADKTAEAEQAKEEAEAELSEGKESLDEALEELNAWEGYTPLRNEILLKFGPEATDRRAVLDAAVEALGDIVTGSALFEDSYVFFRIKADLDPWTTMAFFIPVIFTIIVVLVLFLFLTLMIRQSRREIGILRALGFRAGETRGLFMLLCFLVMIPALAIGTGLSFPLRDFFNSFYQRRHHFPEFFPVFDFRALLVVGAATLGVTQLAALLTTASINRIEPAETMTRQAENYRPVSRGTDRLLSRLRPMTKLSLLSLMRNKLRFAASALCVAGAVAIMFTSLSFLTGREHIETDVFERRIHYDCQVLFSSEPSAELTEEIRRLPYVTGMESAASYEAELAFGGKSEAIPLISLEPGSGMLSVSDGEGRPCAMPDHGLVLEEETAKRLGIGAGDEVTLNGVPVRVAFLSRQTGNTGSNLPPAEAQALGKPAQYSWFIRLEGASGQQLTERLQEEEGYVMTVETSVLRAKMRFALAEFDVFAWMAITFAVLLGLFIILNTNQTNLQEQKRELSILRALGFQRREISLHWFLHSLLYFLCALAVGYPLGYWIVQTAFDKLKSETRHFIFVPEPVQFLVTAGILFLFLAAAHLWTMHGMKKWDVAENVRDKE